MKQDLFQKLMQDTYSDDPVKHRINIFEKVRDLPYEISPRKWQELLKLGRGACEAKHQLLKKAYEKLGYECRLAYVPYSWKMVELPSDLQKGYWYKRRGLHVFLEVKIEGKWTKIDATWNKELKDKFDVNLDWDGFSDQKIAVPSKKIYHPKTKEEILEIRKICKCSSAIKKPSDLDMQWIEKFNKWIHSK